MILPFLLPWMRLLLGGNSEGKVKRTKPNYSGKKKDPGYDEQHNSQSTTYYIGEIKYAYYDSSHDPDDTVQ